MKNGIRWLGILLAAIMLLCGCDLLQPQQTVGKNTEVSQSEEAQEDSQEPEESVMPEEEETIKGMGGVLVQEGVYDISGFLNWQGYTLLNACFLDNTHLLLSLMDANYHTVTRVYDVQEETLTEETKYEESYMSFESFKAGEDHVGWSAFSDSLTTALVYVDGTCRRVELPEGTENVRFYGDGRAAAVYGNVLNRDGEVITLPEQYDGYSLVNAEPDGTILLSTYDLERDGNVYFLVAADGNVTEAYTGDTWAVTYHDWYLVGYEKRVMLYNCQNSRSAVQFTLDSKDESILDIAGNTILTLDLENEVRMYDIYSGALLLQYVCPVNVYSAVLSSDGTLAVLLLDENAIYVVKTGEGESTESGWPGWIQVSTDVDAYVSDLEARYNVQIYVGEDAMYPFPDFAAMPLTDGEYIMESLKQIDVVLGAFPDGFLQELLSGEVTTMRIHLTGQLIGDTEQGTTSNPIAFAYTDYISGTQFIVLDGRSPQEIVTNMAHELMHAIDSRISQRITEDSQGFIHWNEYQPADFWYNYSYQDENGLDYSDSTYTQYDWDHETYFIDEYSKTFDIEDRARIFENLFTAGLEGRTLEEFAGTPLMEKAEYLCQVIRDSFDSVQGETIWEKGLAD